jgi:hypothetical protein
MMDVLFGTALVGFFAGWAVSEVSQSKRWRNLTRLDGIEYLHRPCRTKPDGDHPDGVDLCGECEGRRHPCATVLLARGGQLGHVRPIDSELFQSDPD